MSPPSTTTVTKPRWSDASIKSSLIYARPQILWPYSQFSQSNTKYKMSNRITKRRIYSFQILKCGTKPILNKIISSLKQHMMWVGKRKTKKLDFFLRILEVLDVVNSLAKSIPFLLTKNKIKISFSRDLKAGPSKTGNSQKQDFWKLVFILLVPKWYTIDIYDTSFLVFPTEVTVHRVGIILWYIG